MATREGPSQVFASQDSCGPDSQRLDETQRLASGVDTSSALTTPRLASPSCSLEGPHSGFRPGRGLRGKDCNRGEEPT